MQREDIVIIVTLQTRPCDQVISSLKPEDCSVPQATLRNE